MIKFIRDEDSSRLEVCRTIGFGWAKIYNCPKARGVIAIYNFNCFGYTGINLRLGKLMFSLKLPRHSIRSFEWYLKGGSGGQMNHIEKYCERELQELQEVCKMLSTTSSAQILKTQTLRTICLIALIEINRELDTRKIRKEGQKHG